MRTTNKIRGFTLIELMIVITIIGVLAAVAVPVYQDYTVRARVSECVSVFNPIKTAVTLFATENNQLPTALASLSGVSHTPTNHQGEYVESVTISSGAVSCKLDSDPDLASAAGKKIGFSPSLNTTTGRIEWTISTSASVTDVPSEYLPKL